jgi:hypothetical protein
MLLEAEVINLLTTDEGASVAKTKLAILKMWGILGPRPFGNSLSVYN